MHVALCWQGFDSHSLMSVSQSSPVKPGWQLHLYAATLEIVIHYFSTMCLHVFIFSFQLCPKDCNIKGKNIPVNTSGIILTVIHITFIDVDLTIWPSKSANEYYNAFSFLQIFCFLTPICSGKYSLLLNLHILHHFHKVLESSV